MFLRIGKAIENSRITQPRKYSCSASRRMVPPQTEVVDSKNQNFSNRRIGSVSPKYSSPNAAHSRTMDSQRTAPSACRPRVQPDRE